jgi:alpha-tubulin suppressor-like RCC1 family protein
MKRVLRLAAATVLIACGDLPVAYPRVAASATPILANQNVLVGSPVSVPPSVRVRDHLGAPLAGVPVHFAVTIGGGTLATPEAVTDDAGIASAGSWTTGTGTETNFVSATVDGISGGTVIFGARVIAFKQVSAGASHTCGVTLATVPETFCWGSNTFGEIGQAGSIGTNLSFGRLTSAGLSSVGAGVNHTCGLTMSSLPTCWGRNNVGQLGDGSIFTRAYASGILGAQASSTIAVGADHACGINTNGAAFCWGLNTSGQLGDGSNTTRLSTVAVSGGLKFQQIAAHGNHTCAIATTNVTYCWGENVNGGLGDGTKVNRNTPTAVSGGRVFQSLALGSLHSCGLTSDGTAYCWGGNASGQLGDGTTAERLTPTAVTGGLGFSSLASNGLHTCGLASPGLLAWCWGDNSNGQVGDGTKVNRPSPVAVSDGRSYVQIAAGGLHTCALAPGGQVFCWGANATGQLADGTFTERLTPTLIKVK